MYQTRSDDYAAFRCLAGACPQTCCAAWEIVVDPDAQDAYLRLQHPLAAKLRRVLRVDSEGDTYFAQTDGRCPFLCADGLCELQRTLGEQSLCRTCRDFPRWEVLLCDRVERGLSPACPEAARRLLARTAPLRFVSAPLPDDGYVAGARERRLTAAVTAVRDRVLALLGRPGHTAEENLAAALDLPVRHSTSSTGTALRRWPAGRCRRPMQHPNPWRRRRWRRRSRRRSRSMPAGRSCSGAWRRFLPARRPE